MSIRKYSQQKKFGDRFCFRETHFWVPIKTKLLLTNVLSKYFSYKHLKKGLYIIAFRIKVVVFSHDAKLSKLQIISKNLKADATTVVYLIFGNNEILLNIVQQWRNIYICPWKFIWVFICRFDVRHVAHGRDD